MLPAEVNPKRACEIGDLGPEHEGWFAGLVVHLAFLASERSVFFSNLLAAAVVWASVVENLVVVLDVLDVSIEEEELGSVILAVLDLVSNFAQQL